MNPSPGLMVNAFQVLLVNSKPARQIQRGEAIQLNAEWRPAFGTGQARLASPRA
jgi:hypothetical protein